MVPVYRWRDWNGRELEHGSPSPNRHGDLLILISASCVSAFVLRLFFFFGAMSTRGKFHLPNSGMRSKPRNDKIGAGDWHLNLHTL